MKDKIHPKYYRQAAITCSCGSTFETGSAQKDMEVEVCSSCHPFYTGKQKLVDVAGRVDRFKRRLQESEKAEQSKVDRKKTRKKNQRGSAVKI